MVKVRLTGLPDDVASLAQDLHTCYRIVEESPDYPRRRSQLVNRYLTIAKMEENTHVEKTNHSQRR